MQEIVLDPAIRDWVLLPITLLMVLIGIFRHELTLFLQARSASAPDASLAKVTTPENETAFIAETQLLVRARAFRAHCHVLPYDAMIGHVHALTETIQARVETLSKLPDATTPPAPPNPLSDPKQMEVMMQGMTKQMTMFIPQTLIMTLINYFFEGFILVRLPFPLTEGFRGMLQRGIDVPRMDVRWVSSLSWYFLNLFGLRTIFTWLLGDNNAADAAREMQAMNPAAMLQQPTAASPTLQVPSTFERIKLLRSEVEHLDVIRRSDRKVLGEALQNVECRIIAMLQRQGTPMEKSKVQ